MSRVNRVLTSSKAGVSGALIAVLLHASGDAIVARLPRLGLTPVASEWVLLALELLAVAVAGLGFSPVKKSTPKYVRRS